MDYPRFVTQEMVSVEWLSDNRNDRMSVYADDYRWLLLYSLGINTTSISGSSQPGGEGPFPPNTDSYIYLGKENIVNNNIVLTNYTIRGSPVLESKPISETKVFSVLAASDRIFDDGASTVFKTNG
jgi:uncharacterized membrane protein